MRDIGTPSFPGDAAAWEYFMAWSHQSSTEYIIGLLRHKQALELAAHLEDDPNDLD